MCSKGKEAAKSRVISGNYLSMCFRLVERTLNLMKMSTAATVISGKLFFLLLDSHHLPQTDSTNEIEEASSLMSVKIEFLLPRVAL